MEFLTADWLGTPAWFWLSFLGLVAALTAFDLGVLPQGRPRDGDRGDRSSSSAFYIAIALAFGAWIWVERGADLGMKYYTGFFIEKALSIDNVFVISLIFTFFAIPPKYQYRALVWGIIAVIVLRGIMIAAGAALVAEAYWVLYIFAAFLIATGIKMFFAGDKPMDVGNNPVVRWISSHMRVTKELHAQHFFVHGARREERQDGARGDALVPGAGGDQPGRPGVRGRQRAGDLRHHHRHVHRLHQRTSWRSSACARSISRCRR